MLLAATSRCQSANSARSSALEQTVWVFLYTSSVSQHRQQITGRHDETALRDALRGVQFQFALELPRR